MRRRLQNTCGKQAHVPMRRQASQITDQPRGSFGKASPECLEGRPLFPSLPVMVPGRTLVHVLSTCWLGAGVPERPGAQDELEFELCC